MHVYARLLLTETAGDAPRTRRRVFLRFSLSHSANPTHHIKPGGIHLRTATRLLLIAAVIVSVAAPAGAQLNYQGQGGVFINPLAYPTASGKLEVATHYIDLDGLGALSTYSLTKGIGKGVEIGYTRFASHVSGVNSQNLLHAKWQLISETPTRPAVAFSVLDRNLVGGANSAEAAVIASKAIPLGQQTLILDLGFRGTKAVGDGLFGIHNSWGTKWEGAAALALNKNVIVGTEFRQQIDGRSWSDIALRFTVNDHLNLDLGVANFAPGLNRQIAAGITWKP